MDDSTEHWLPVSGYEGYYEVSNMARVRSVPRRTRDGRRISGRIRRPGHHKHGYDMVDLWRDNRCVSRTVHSLVAEAFIGPYPEGMEVRHGDGDPANSRLSNLSFGTRIDNAQDSIRHGTNDRASRTHCPAGHEYTLENTAIGRRGNGNTFRICRICSQETKRRYQERRQRSKSAARLQSVTPISPCV